MTPPERSGSPLGVAIALAIVYLVWGSTYLAIRFAIETLPTFTMAGARFLLAGSLLYGFARATGTARPPARSWGPAALIGALLLLGGNGAVVWAEHRIPSGIAALLVAVEPVFIALLAPLLLGGRRPGLRVFAGLAAGIAGVAILVIDPRGLDASSVDLLGSAAVVLGALSWALGSLASVRVQAASSPALSTGMQMLAGGLLLALAGGLAGEWQGLAVTSYSTRSLVAFGYLVVLGSIVAFSAYSYLLRAARPAVVATYAFVNPVVAVVLGWALAGESLSWRVAAAAVLILAALALILGEREGDGAAPRSEDEPALPTDAAKVARLASADGDEPLVAPEALPPQAAAAHTRRCA